MSGTSSLQQLSASFKQWRATKKHKERIPEELWAQVEAAAKSHPLSHVSKAGGLDFYQLRARIQKSREAEKSLAPINVTKVVANNAQFFTPVVEIETANGTKIRFYAESESMRTVVQHMLGG